MIDLPNPLVLSLPKHGCDPETSFDKLRTNRL